MVVSEAGIRAGLEEGLDRRNVPAEGCVVQGRPANLHGKKNRTEGGEREMVGLVSKEDTKDTPTAKGGGK